MEKEEEEQTFDNFEPLLGMIIKITSPSDNRFNNKYFLIEYLDEQIMKIIDENYNKYELSIENNQLAEKSISYITPIKTPVFPGYAKQNNMEPGTWWTIEYNPENGNPSLYNGEIINLEEDQIEFKIENTDDILYIDFQYKGIPLDMPIKFYKAKNPMPIQQPVEIDDQLTVDPRFEEEGGWADMMDDDEDEETKDIEEIETEKKTLIFEADQIEFKILDENVTFNVEKEEDEKIYHISVQTDDLLQSILAKIPSNKRTPQKLQEISLIINRFIELRREYSEFNEFDNTENWIKYNEQKPIVNSLKKLDKNINWIIPIVNNQLEIYFNPNKNIQNDNDMIVKGTHNSHLNEYQLKENYYQKKYDNEEFNKYEYINTKTFKPNHILPFNKNNIMTQLEGKYSIRTNANLLTISNNLQNLQSSIIDTTNDKLNITTFNTHVYITGQYKLNPIKNDLHERIQYSKNDIVPLSGLLILPQPYLKKSQETFFSTSIFNKANLHQSPLYYFNYLKQNKHIRKKSINVNSDANTLLNLENNNLYLFDQNNVNYDDRNKTHDLNMFLNKIIPSTKDIVSNLIDKKYFDRCPSFDRFLFKLQPFFIRHKHIDNESYGIINNQLRTEINYFRSTRQKLINDINLYFKSLPSSYYSLSPLATIIPKEEKNNNEADISKKEENDIKNQVSDSISKAYNIIENELRSEYLQKMINLDYSNYFYNCVVFNQLDIINDINIESVIEDLNKKIEASQNIFDDNQKTSTCVLLPSSLSKRYANMELLQNDENMVTYFDKDLDETRYDIYEELDYINQIIDPLKKKKTLMNHLITELDVPEEEANQQAISMIEGKKLVNENDYAVLDNGTNELRYYKRQNNRWVLDETYNNVSIEEIKFCNLRSGCIKVNKKCESIDNIQENMQLELTKEMLDKVENELRTNTEDMKNNIKDLLQSDLKNIILLTKLNENKENKYDIMKSNIGLNSTSIEYEKSPSIEIRDNILNTQDIVLKYDRILKFVDKFCRFANIDEGEDNNWFYCSLSLDQSFRLMPTFFNELAISFSTGNYNAYYQTLENIKRERGELSDDGDKIIDKYSGYEISKIMSSTVEGYEASGRKIISRGVIDNIFDDQLKEQEEELKNDAKPEKISIEEELDQYSMNIQKILPGIDKHLGIDVSSQYKFISKNVLHLMEKKLLKEKKWLQENDKDMENLDEKEKKKKYAKHKIDFYCKTLIGLYIIAIQTNIPHIKKGKGFTGCVEAFNGWPMGEGDDFLTYIVCSLIIIRGSGKVQNIWQALPKYKKDKKDKNEQKYVEKLKKFIKKNIMKLDDVKDKLQKKVSFLKQNNVTIETVTNFDYKKWHNFLPPLIDFTLNKLTSPNEKIKNVITTSFQDNNQMKSRLYMNNLLSQIQNFSLSVQEDIQRIINKQPDEELLLKSQSGDSIFLENACCNESNDSPYEYFINKEKDNNIKDHNEKVKELQDIYDAFNNLSKSSMFNSLENTRQLKIEKSNRFSEKTIYQSFITFCKFNSDIPLNEQLQAFCSTNESGFNNLHTLEEKIEILKSENHKFDNETLITLLRYIGENSNPRLLENIQIESSKYIFEKLLEDNKDKWFISNIYKSSYNIIDRFDVGYSEKTDNAVDELLKTLNTETETIYLNIKKILHKKRNKSLEKAFDDINLGKKIPEMEIKRGEETYMKKQDENGYFMYNFLLSMAKNISYIYPHRILSGIRSYDHYLAYWNIKTLKDKLGSANYNELLELDNFSDNNNVKEVLKKVIYNTQDIILFFENLPFYAEIGNIHSIFNGQMIESFSYYLFLCVIMEYFNVIDSLYENVIKEASVLKRSQLKNEKETLTKDIIDLIYSYSSIINKYRKNIMKSRFDILESGKKFREKDRDDVTRAYKLLSDDEKKVEKLKQQHKLGKWGVGATKAIFQYDDDFTERELKRLEKRTLDEYRFKKNDSITDDLINTLDLQEAVDQIERERQTQQYIDIENDFQNVLGEDEDNDDLEQLDLYE